MNYFYIQWETIQINVIVTLVLQINDLFKPARCLIGFNLSRYPGEHLPH